ncbi:MAG: hypothetical protein V1790_17555 [Planctomycetota bacterium]
MSAEGAVFQDTRGFDSLYYEGNIGDLLGALSQWDGNLYSIEDGVTDWGAAIPLRWMSGYLDQGAGNNKKTYQDLVIDHNTGGATLTVELVTDNGAATYNLGNIVSTVRTQTVLKIPAGAGEEGIKAKNCAVLIYGDTLLEGNTNIGCQIFQIFLHYYIEARGAKHHDTDELDLGTQQVKRLRALELDLENSTVVYVQAATDMPGTAMATRFQREIAVSGTRRKIQVPVADYVEGRHLRVLVYGTEEFYLYGLKAWIQRYGTYIEAYESGAGAIYDSFDVPIAPGHVCVGKCLELDLDTDGEVRAEVLTDLPGNNLSIKRGATFDTTTTTTGRRMMRIPTEPYLEGRLWRVKLRGSSAMRLYGAKLEVKPYGVYVEGYESAAGRTWESDSLDCGTPKVKEFREIQLDLDTDGPITVNVVTEMPGLTQDARQSYTIDTTDTTPGRRMYNLPIAPAVEGRLLKITITAVSAAFRLWGAYVFFRPVGYYVEAYQAGLGHIWDSSIIDLGSEKVKRILQVEVEAHTDAALTATIYTSNAAGEMASRSVQTVPPGLGRRTYMLPMVGVYGRLLRVTLAGTAAFRLFQVRAYVKPIGVYLEAGTSQLCMVEAEHDVGSERIKLFKEIEVIYDGAGTLDFSTDLPKSDVTLVRSFTLATTTGTETLKLRLPPTAQGRLLKVQLQAGAVDLKVFQIRVWTRTIGENGIVLWQWIPMPIPQTPEQYAWADVYVAPTAPVWEWAELPVPKTPLDWSWFDLPVTKTPELPEWVDLPVSM